MCGVLVCYLLFAVFFFDVSEDTKTKEKLTNFILVRPREDELMEKGILKDEQNDERKIEKHKKLEKFFGGRPPPERLIEKNILNKS